MDCDDDGFEKNGGGKKFEFLGFKEIEDESDEDSDASEHIYDSEEDGK